MKSIEKLSVLAIVALSSAAVAHAGSIQFTSASQLSASDTTLTFPSTSVSTPVSSPVSYSAGGNTLTFSDAGSKFELDQVGVTYFTSGFANGTEILYAAGFSGAAAPITIDFLNPVGQVGFNAEEFAGGNENFTFSAFDNAVLIGSFMATGNDPNSLAFLGLSATGGDAITSLVVSDTQGNNIALGPIAFGASSPSPVPEPSTMVLMGTGLFGLAGAVFLSNHVRA